jgi:ATP-dependent RNA helicase DeaD
LSNEETEEKTEAKEEQPEAPASSDYVSDRKFSDFPLSAEIVKAIVEMEYEYATPIQAACIEPGLAGIDIVARAKTGTGKTAAFSISSIDRLEDGRRTPGMLILAPTRELAQQIAEECNKIAAYRDLDIAVLVGGLSINPQEKALNDGAAIIVGTPGRVKDHIKRGNLDLSTLQTAILDEADEMLSMGFYEDVTSILDKCPNERQVLLFSATISRETERLIAKYLKDPEQIILSTDEDRVEGIDHIAYETSPDFHKVRSLLYLLDLEQPTSAIVFCNTREDTATVATFLDKQGLDVQLLSGELPQGRRSQVMAKVKSGEVKYLISTDVASRGIDISRLSHVINYSLPKDPPIYLHRSGRTGRIGKQGRCISLIGGSDFTTRKTLETQFNIEFIDKEFPDPETIIAHRVERQAKQIKEAMGSIIFESYLPTVRALKERPDGDALLAAALRTFFQWRREQRNRDLEVNSLDSLREARREKAEGRSGGRSGGRNNGRGRGGRGNDNRGKRNHDDGGHHSKGRGGRGRNKGRGGKPQSGGGSNVKTADLDALLSSD